MDGRSSDVGEGPLQDEFFSKLVTRLGRHGPEATPGMTLEAMLDGTTLEKVVLELVEPEMWYEKEMRNLEKPECRPHCTLYHGSGARELYCVPSPYPPLGVSFKMLNLEAICNHLPKFNLYYSSRLRRRSPMSVSDGPACPWFDTRLLAILHEIRCVEPIFRNEWCIQSIYVTWEPARSHSDGVHYAMVPESVGEEFDTYPINTEKYVLHLKGHDHLRGRAGDLVEGQAYRHDLLPGHMYTSAGVYRHWQHGCDWKGERRCIQVGYARKIKQFNFDYDRPL